MHLALRCLSLTALGVVALSAQAPPPPVKLGDHIVLSGSIRSRLESWDWFTPNSGDPNYTFLGNQLRIGLSSTGKLIDWTFELESPVLLNLPENAVGPGAQGQLGLGASYYVSNRRNQNAAGLFPKQAFVKFKDLFGNKAASIRLGRFEFQDGSEVVARNPTIGVLKRDRIQQRLLGPFGFTHVWRSFDGFHFVVNKPKINYTVIAALPTRGVFQVDGWGWMKTAFTYASATGQVQASKTSTGEWRVFGIYYDDWRTVLKTDNRSAAARTADLASIRLGNFGGHYVHAFDTASGTLDILGEAVAQVGKWGNLDQRSYMAMVEAGFQPKILPALKPWLRAGYNYGSGDSDPNDKKHGTFVQLLPTPRPYARFPFFDMMNNEDRFTMLTLRPHKQLTLKSEQHFLRLSNRNDLWYAGGGAFQPWTFGFQGRATSGARSLANLYDISADIVVNGHFSTTLYYGYADGKAAIRAVYPRGRVGHLGFLEVTYKF
jgi:hypothetical protein